MNVNIVLLRVLAINEQVDDQANETQSGLCGLGAYPVVISSALLVEAFSQEIGEPYSASLVVRRPWASRGYSDPDIWSPVLCRRGVKKSSTEKTHR